MWSYFHDDFQNLILDEARIICGIFLAFLEKIWLHESQQSDHNSYFKCGPKEKLITMIGFERIQFKRQVELLTYWVEFTRQR